MTTSFLSRHLDKQPLRVVEPEPTKVKQLSRPGTVDWRTQPQSVKQLLRDTVFRIKCVVKTRRMQLAPYFRDFDKVNNNHVTNCQMRRVFSMNTFELTEKEVQALIVRFSDNMGFNYWKFLKEIDDVDFCESKHQEILKLLKIVNKKQSLTCVNPTITIVDVLAKVKNQITRKRINIDQFLRNGEKLNCGNVLESKFRSSFSAAGIILDDCELNVLCNA